MKKVYLLFGPTGVGKSDLLEIISKKREISLISADSVQVYKHLDIGSAKPSLEERKLFPHFLIDIKEPNENYSVAQFINDAEKAIQISISNNRLPIISGGTAFYYKHFLYGLSKCPESNIETRKRVEEIYNEKGLEFMYSWLEKIDEVSSKRIHPNDKYRILRAIEVYEDTRKPLSYFALPDKKRSDYKFVIIGLERSREELRKRIKQRLEKMFDMGLENEVDWLKKMGLTLENQSMNAIGYREFFQFNTINEIRENIYMNTVHYAKRQMTFFRSIEGTKWIKL